jgi:trk system potassium uptake protein TrkA
MSSKQRFVLIGIGAFGKEIARTLKFHNAEVVIMDKRPEVINQMKLEGFEYTVEINSTDAMTLARFIRPDDSVILAMGESFEDNILTVGILSELGVKKIYTRATTEIQVKILERMDVAETLFPEKQEGKRFALKLLYEHFKFIEEFAPEVLISEIPVPENFFNKTIIELNIRNRFNVNVIGLKQRVIRHDGTETQKFFALGFENISLNHTHSLVIVGDEFNIRRLASEAEDHNSHNKKK